MTASTTSTAPSPARPPIEFWFDFISPFGYFASLRIDDLATRHGRTVDWTSMPVSYTHLTLPTNREV